jgi:TPR repeat protein
MVRYHLISAISLSAILLLAFLARPYITDPVSNAMRLMEQGDYKGLFAIWDGTVHRGDFRARNTLARLFQEGHGFDQKRSDAMTWLQSRAESGDAEAQTDLGTALYGGFVFQRDRDQAREWLFKAAEQGYARAQALLGQCFDLGIGGSQDYEQARFWYAKAAVQGYPLAQRNLARLYDFGFGGPKDPDEAWHWYQIARASYQALLKRQKLYAAESLAYLYFAGRGGAVDYERARSLYRTAAENGNGEAAAVLGSMFQYGQGGPADIDAAISWYRKSVENENPRGQYLLGLLYEKGTGLPKDLAQAIALYKAAAEESADDPFFASLNDSVRKARDRAVQSLESSTGNSPTTPSTNDALSGTQSIAQAQSSAQNDLRPDAFRMAVQNVYALAEKSWATLIVALLLFAGFFWTLCRFVRPRRAAQDADQELREFMKKNTAKTDASAKARP